jgi:hypothetical protein
MKLLLPLCCLFFLLVSCADEPKAETEEVFRPGSLYQNFQVWGEEGREDVTVRLQFHEGNRNGDAILLDNPGTVFLDDIPLPADSTKFNGVFYEISLPVAGFAGSHTIRFMGSDGKEYKEKFSFAPFSLAKDLPAEIKRKPFDLQLQNFGKGSEFVRLVMVDTAMQSADVNEDILVEEGKLSISDEHLANLTDGPVYLEIYREQEQLVRNGARGGGKLVITYALKRQFNFLP